MIMIMILMMMMMTVLQVLLIPHLVIPWFFTADPTLFTYHSTLFFTLMSCLGLILPSSLLLLAPRLPRCRPHLVITRFDIDNIPTSPMEDVAEEEDGEELKNKQMKN